MFLLLLLVPNLLWTRYKPAGYTPAGENCVLAAFERVGEVSTVGTSLPVAAFFLLGIYGRVVWLMLSAVILGVGHIGIHLQHRSALD